MNDLLPCVKFNCPCPFLDRKENGWEGAVCYGVRGGKKLAALRDCPQIEVARAEWAKANKKPACGEADGPKT